MSVVVLISDGGGGGGGLIICYVYLLYKIVICKVFFHLFPEFTIKSKILNNTLAGLTIVHISL